MSHWTPIVGDGTAPLYGRIADAIERDIRSGRLEAGARLPPHRDLAQSLAVSIGTVTKAYGEAERRGLISSHVGRGSFVDRQRAAAAPVPAESGVINLAHNIPPAVSSAQHLADALMRLRRRPDLARANGYMPPEGLDSVRRAAADWLRRRHGVDSLTADDLIQCNGAQHGMALAFAAACRPGDTVLCEAATFNGMKSIAEYSGYRLTGVAMDAEGILPDALDRAITAHHARVLYTIPTLQNPTTITTSAARRRQIAEIARRRDVLIIEDDAYRPIAMPQTPLPTFVDLVPERTIYIATLSKSLSPGLRLGFLSLPNRALREHVLRGIRATGYSAPPFGGLIFTQWAEDGIADVIAEEILVESLRRTDLARSIFGARMTPLPSPQSLHIWLPMPPLEAERAAGRAGRAGIEVTPADAPIIDPEQISGLRLCLGAAASIDVLERGLRVVAQALHREVDGRGSAII